MSLSRPRSKCNGDNSHAKLFNRGLADIYLNGMGCPNVKEIPCLIPQVESILTLDEQNRLPPCSSWAQYNCMIKRLSQEMGEFLSSLDKDCKLKTVHLSSQKTYYLEDMPGHEVISFWLSIVLYVYIYPLSSKNETFEVHHFFEDTTIKVFNEYYLYDFNAIISAVGGSMGLFLGFSFYSTAKLLIDRLV